MKTGHFPEEKERLTYTIAELSRLTGLSARTWWNLIRAGALPTVRIGSRVLVSHPALIEYLAKRSDRTGAPSREPPEHIRRRQEKARLASRELGRRAT